MNLSILRRRSPPLLGALAEAEWRARAGLAPGAEFASLFRQFADVCSLDALACAREAASSGDEEAKARGRLLAERIVRLLEAQRTAAIHSERLAFEAHTALTIEGAPLPLRAAERRIGAEPERPVRAQVAQAWAGVLPALDAPLARRVDACQRLANDLEEPSYEALISKVSGIDLAALAADAERALVATEDAWRDLASFALRHLVGSVGLRPRGEAGWHDLVRIARMARFDDLFRASRLYPAVQGFLETIGLSPEARGWIELDLEARPLKQAGPVVAALSVPDRIVVSLGRVGGAPDYRGLFNALGRAHHRAGTGDEAELEGAWFGDDAVNAGYGLTFEHVLADPDFLRRHLGAEPKDAVEATRFVALVALARLRRDCAQLLFERALYQHGAGDELRGFARETVQKALLVDWPIETWLWDVEPGFEVARRLRAWPLQAALREALLAHCNEDWWRNPRTGAFLSGLFRRGQRTDAVALASELGGPTELAGGIGWLVAAAAR